MRGVIDALVTSSSFYIFQLRKGKEKLQVNSVVWLVDEMRLNLARLPMLDLVLRAE